MIVYQWNQSREDNLQGQFNFYYSIARDSVSKGSMFLYIILLLVVSLIGDTIFSLCQALFALLT